MKKIKRNPEKFESINLFASMAQQNNYKIGDNGSIENFALRVGKSVKENMTDIMVHGNRTESMFSYMVSSLGEILIIKKEDAGDAFVVNENINIPDYRIVTKEKYQFLVEVKSYNSLNFNSQYKMKKKYRDSLLEYGRVMSIDVKIAIYWTKFRTWTLVTFDDFFEEDKNIIISFPQAFSKNNMIILGDKMIGTKPNLVLKLWTDLTLTKKVNEKGTYQIVIKSVELLCNDKVLVDKLEQNIAFYLMQYGDWISEEPRALIEDEQLKCIEHICHPREEKLEDYEKNGFVMIGTLSQMATAYYTSLTAPEGQVERIYPESDTVNLGLTIPENYKGKELPLWIFSVLPNNE